MKVFRDFNNIHKAQDIIVCGCGESLRELTHPERFITIGVNDVGRSFHPDYLVVVNPRRQFSGDRFHFVETSQAKYLFTQLDLGISHPNIVKFKLGKYGGTNGSDPNVLHYAQNSPYVAVCLAAYMGAKRIGLIGVDFTDNHFFAKTGRHVLAKQVQQIDEQYRRLREALNKSGIELVNLSSISKLMSLPRRTIDEFAQNMETRQVADQEQTVEKTAHRIFFVHYRFLSCGDVFKHGLDHASAELGFAGAGAYWDDPRLPEKVAAFRPDLLFVVHGRKFVKRWPGAFPSIRKAVWLLDEPYEVDDTARWSGAFDTVFLNDPGTLDRHRNAYYLPAGYDPVLHQPTPGEKKYDVGFIGGYNRRREEYLLRLQREGLLSYVVGGPWQAPELRRLCRSGNIPAEETARLYQQTRIVINVFREVHHFNEAGTPGTSMNPRVYEALACGALVVSEYRPEIGKIFPEMPVFRTVDELAGIIGDLLKDDEKRETIRAACRTRLNGHAYRDRLKEVVALMLNGKTEAKRHEACNLSEKGQDTMKTITNRPDSGDPGPQPSASTDAVDIVMLTYNRLKYLERTVDALFERTRHPFRLTIVDNNSQSDVRAYLEKKRARFHNVILNERNEYVPAFHRGIATTTSPVFVATEPDIVVPELSPCWLTQYLEFFRNDPRLGLLGIRLDPKDKSPATPSWAGGIDSAPVYNKRILLGNVGIWMMAIRRSAYPGAFPSDGEMCAAVRKRKFVVGYTRDIIARHLGWYEYRDYPEYLLEKSKRPHPCFPHYAEAQLVDREMLANKMRPTIVTTTFNGRLAWLKELLKSIETYTAPPFTVIVVDNGTTDGTREFLKGQDWITTIRNEKNLDDTKGVNQALKLVKTEYIVKIDTDALITGCDWWKEIYRYMEGHPEVGMAGDVWNPRFDLSSRLYKPGWLPKQHGLDNLNHVQGGFMVLRKKMLDAIGRFNEEYTHNGMDVEISYRAISYGWKLGHIDFVKSQIIHEPANSSAYKVLHPVKNSPLRSEIVKRINEVNPTKSFYAQEPTTSQNGAWTQKLKPGAVCRTAGDEYLIIGKGWDNCLISKLSYQDAVFSVGISELQGSAIIKIRLQHGADPASNSYHVILGEWGNYVAKACHVFERFTLPAGNPIWLQMATSGRQIQVSVNGTRIASFDDPDLQEGYISIGVKDGQAKFLHPTIEQKSTIESLSVIPTSAEQVRRQLATCDTAPA